MALISGNLEGLKVGQRRDLERLGERRVPPGEVIHAAFAAELMAAARDMARQVGVTIGRDGGVREVVVGGQLSVVLPEGGRAGGPSPRLAGERFVHVHLKGELIDIEDILLLTKRRLDLVAALLPDAAGRSPLIQLAYPVFTPRHREPYEKVGPLPVGSLSMDVEALTTMIEAELRRVRSDAAPTRRGDQGRAILVRALLPADAGEDDARASLDELGKLAWSAGVTVADRIVQRRARVDPATFVGKGKLIDAIVRGMVVRADTLIFDHDLTPRQVRSIEDTTRMRAIDRTQLILDIFAQRAQTRDGKIQVELAQLKYLMPRLAERDDALSRLTGGIGARGPGETKLEIGRRRVRERIARLARQVEEIAQRRRVMRAQREKSGVALVAIVGYTNAGKTTLLNALCGCDEAAEDRLFRTLDPRTRRLRLPSGREVVLTDTVGLIRRLPPSLLAAFRPTFEEIAGARLVVVLLDASDERMAMHLAMVGSTLEGLALDAVPRLHVLNKIDAAGAGGAWPRDAGDDAVAISARDGTGLDTLLERIDRMLG